MLINVLVGATHLKLFPPKSLKADSAQFPGSVDNLLKVTIGL